MSFRGRCLCGKVDYRSDAGPIFAGNCYCRDCQKESGAGHITGVGVPDASLTINGLVSTFTKKADSGGTITNTFCPNCGVVVVHRASNLPGVAIIRAGTLDDASSVKPEMNLYVSSAQPWDPPAPGLLSFERMPPREGGR